MKFLTRSAVLLSAFILPTALNAASVIVDGANCGELATMSVNAAGQVTISTGPGEKCTVGAVTPPPGGTFRVSVTKPAGGNITGGGINCGVSGNICYVDVTEGAGIQLSAAPSSAGYSHGNWGSDCAGSGVTSSACTLSNITAAKSVSATFTYVPPATPGCPDLVDCSKTLPWPVSPQQNLVILGSATTAYKIEIPGGSGSGKLQSGYTSGVSANREFALSVNPGEFNVPAGCRRTGTPSTNIYWKQVSVPSQNWDDQKYECQIPSGAVAYVNVRATRNSEGDSGCPAGASCGFFLKNYNY